MNNPHRTARLTVPSREQIVARIVAGQTAAEVAVSVQTVRKWLARLRARGARRFAARDAGIDAVPRRDQDRLIVWMKRENSSPCEPI